MRGTIHWVSADHAVDAEGRLYDHLFSRENPDEVLEGGDYRSNLAPDSLVSLTACKVEPSLAGPEAGMHLQFERLGYFCVDPDSEPGRPVFNRTVGLRDTWAKIAKKQRK